RLGPGSLVVDDAVAARRDLACVGAVVVVAGVAVVALFTGVEDSVAAHAAVDVAEGLGVRRRRRVAGDAGRAERHAAAAGLEDAAGDALTGRAGPGATAVAAVALDRRVG